METESANRWTKPKSISQVQLVFPANIVGEYLPLMEEIPAEFKDWNENNHWVKQVTTWFFFGVDLAKSKVKFKSTFTEEDQKNAWRHLSACLNSFEPKHEHKEAGVAYLLSLWFDELEFVSGKKNKARCRACGDIIQSFHRHDFKRCKCGKIFVDGGLDYTRRGGDPADLEELSEYSQDVPQFKAGGEEGASKP